MILILLTGAVLPPVQCEQEIGNQGLECSCEQDKVKKITTFISFGPLNIFLGARGKDKH
jgi:hypothetical protein